MLKKIFIIVNFLLISVVSLSLTLEENYIKDEYGNKVEAKEYKKIIVSDPGVIEILLKIEGEKNIAAISKPMRSRIYPIEKVEKIASIGSDVTNINYEKVLEYNPDLIIINAMMLKNLEKLKTMGYKVLVSKADKLEDIINLIEIVGIISEKKENAKILKEISLEKLKKIEGMNKKLKGIILYSTNPMIAFTESSLPGNVLKHLGVENIAAKVKGERPIISPEYVLKENPDFIGGAMSLNSPNQILEASNVIKMTKAAKENNIFILDSSIILRDSYRIFDEILNLKESLEKIN